MLVDDYTIKLRPFGEVFGCSDSETLVEALERAGQPIPFGCRGGHCGACKSKTIEGEVETTSEASEFVLTPQEREEGYILLCCALPVTDVVEIEPLFFDEAAVQGQREVITEVDRIEQLAPDIRLITLDLVLPDRLEFTPGQHVEVKVPGTGERRLYSIASAPGSGRIDLLVRLVPGGVFSNYVAERIRPGAELRLTGPYGACVLRPSDRPLVLVGRGSGMAPHLSILGHLARHQPDRQVTLFMGGSTEQDLFLEDRLELRGRHLPNLRVVTSLSRPGPGWSGRTGRITDHLAGLELPPGGVEAHVCGPPAMVEAAVAELRRLGVPAADIAYEPFTHAPKLRSAS